MNKTLTDVLVIGAGPIGLFSVFELGQLGMKSCVVDSLDIIGGQCSSLYPEKPIYDIPAYPEISGQKLIDNLFSQIKPFSPKFILGERVEKITKESDEFLVFTSNNKTIRCNSNKCSWFSRNISCLEVNQLTNNVEPNSFDRFGVGK